MSAAKTSPASPTQPVPIHPPTRPGRCIRAGRRTRCAAAAPAPARNRRGLRRVLMLGGILVVLGGTTVGVSERRSLRRHRRCVRESGATDRHHRRLRHREVRRRARRPTRRGGRRAVSARRRAVRDCARQREGDDAAGRDDGRFAEGRLPEGDAAGERTAGDGRRREDDARSLRVAGEAGIDCADAVGSAAGDVPVGARDVEFARSGGGRDAGAAQRQSGAAGRELSRMS